MRVFENILYVFVGITIATLMVVVITQTEPQFKHEVYPITINELSSSPDSIKYTITQNGKTFVEETAKYDFDKNIADLKREGYTVILK